MAIPLYAAIPGTGTIRQLDVRGTVDDYDGTVPITPTFTSNPLTPAGSGGYARLRRLVQSGVAGTSAEVLTATAVRDGAEDAASISRAFPAAGVLTVPLSGPATQLAVVVTLVGVPGTELGSAELWSDPRRTLRSGDGT